MEHTAPSLLVLNRRYCQRYYALECANGSLYCELQPVLHVTHNYVDWDLPGTFEKRASKVGEGSFQ
jgi:hypothetical protein